MLLKGRPSRTIKGKSAQKGCYQGKSETLIEWPPRLSVEIQPIQRGMRGKKHHATERKGPCRDASPSGQRCWVEGCKEGGTFGQGKSWQRVLTAYVRVRLRGGLGVVCG